MRSDDLFDGITQVRDDLVEQSAPKKKNKKLWLGAVAAVLAMAIGVGILWPGGWRGVVTPGTTSDPYLGTLVNSPYAVALAHYPKQTPYPNEDDFIGLTGDLDLDKYDSAYNAWADDRFVRLDALRDYDGELDGFFFAVMEQFLSGEDGENRVISPSNLYMALAMLAEVTDGDSRQQVLDLLGAESIEQLREQAGRVWTGLYQDDGATTVLLGNSLWMDQNVKFVRETMDTLARDYYASSFRGEMGSAAFDQTLRDWLNAQTGGLLKEQAAELSLDPETVLALASTIYFKAKWYAEFSENRTAPGVFHSPSGDMECEFMHQGGSNIYYWGDGFSAICRPFTEGGSMWLILPDEGVRAEDLLSDPQVMEMIQGPNTWENRKYLTVDQSIPKFDVVSDQDLIQGLQALGLTDVFDPAVSDFTSMTTQVEGIFLSQVQHAARVKIDEEGCEAAAFTVIQAPGAGMPPEERVDFVLDRPFLFVVTSEIGAFPLFAGIVNQP